MLAPRYRRASGWPEVLLLAVPLALLPLESQGSFIVTGSREPTIGYFVTKLRILPGT